MSLPDARIPRIQESTMNAMNEMPAPLVFTDAAAAKVKR